MKEKIAEFYQLLFGFRKFIVALMVLIVSITFRCKNLLNGVEFVDLAKSVTLGFFGTNTVEGIVTVVKDHLQQRRDAGNVLVPPTSKSADVSLVIPEDVK